ncbi:MAG TPA: flagellar biosynthetic protein FliR, partial [Syntrophales bacterium]|nr:flagellar biosynthetic protein FliR [Syntrophales bacterium]
HPGTVSTHTHVCRMNLPAFQIEQVIGFILVLMRVGAIIIMIPVFGERVVPAQVKAGLSVIVAGLIYPVLPVNVGDFKAGSTIELLIRMGGEVIIGVAIGFVARIVFAAVQTAGELMGFQMGVAVANVVDPVSSTQISILSEFLYLVALLVFVTVDGHHIFLASIIESYRFIPILHGFFGAEAAREMLNMTTDVFVTGIKIAAPVVAVIIFVNVGLGLIARTVPQINVFIVGFPLQVFVGIMFLGIAMPFIIALIVHEIDGLWPEIRRIMSIMTG